MNVRSWFACSACSQKDALLGAQLKTIDSLLGIVKDAETSRRALETALAAIASERAVQAAERTMGVAPKPLDPPRTRIVDGASRRPLSPFMNTLYGGGHLDKGRDDRRTVIPDEEPNEVPSEEQ